MLMIVLGQPVAGTCEGVAVSAMTSSLAGTASGAWEDGLLLSSVATGSYPVGADSKLLLGEDDHTENESVEDGAGADGTPVQECVRDRIRLMVDSVS